MMATRKVDLLVKAHFPMCRLYDCLILCSITKTDVSLLATVEPCERTLKHNSVACTRDFPTTRYTFRMYLSQAIGVQNVKRIAERIWRKSGSYTSKGNVTTLYTPPTHVTAVATYASLTYPLAALSFGQLHVLDRVLAAAGFTHHNLRLADCLSGQHLVCLVALLQPHATTLSLFSNRI
jgi:hypothetical protein